MSHTTCCIKSCHNNGRNSKCKFFSFPVHKKQAAQRVQWINIVRKVNKSDQNWEPRHHHLICSSHFVGGRKSKDPMSPAYIPSIFANVTISQQNSKQAALKRYERLIQRRGIKSPLKGSKSKTASTNPLQDHCYFSQKFYVETVTQTPANRNDSSSGMESTEDVLACTHDNNEIIPCDQSEGCNESCMTEMREASPADLLEETLVRVIERIQLIDEACQVYTEVKSQIASESYTCIKYHLPNGTVDAEIQTDILQPSCKVVKIKNNHQFKDKQCGTPHKTYADACVGPSNEPQEETKPHGFFGVPSIRSEREYLALAGVTQKNFQFLLKQISHSEKSRIVTKENKLLIVLMKLKCGLSFTAIACLFNIHRTWVSKLFSSALDELLDATGNLIFWPSREVVRKTMPQCFIPEYENVRVIIDCTEFRLECPASVENRVLSYSNYKKGFTARALIGITPSGFISFKSALSGGRKSDCQLTVESGLLALLENGDVVLADKGFPSIQNKINEEGKEVMVVMPPFLQKNNAFTKEETEKTYSVARVRIHVERIMQRIRIYKILDKIPAHLFKSADKILEMCCILVNLQPPIFDEKNADNLEKEF